jgi:tetratricopeptide (TPR) repeat protein
MSKNPQMQKKAKTYLEKAFKMNPKSLESLLSLAEYYQTENTQKAIDLLNENLQYFVCDLIHRRLGDLYFCIEEWKMASDEYQIAININPENHEAKKGLSDVERAINGVIDDEEMSESGDDMEVHSVEND